MVWAVSKACTKYDMDMGFYLSPWDESDKSYGYRDANGNALTKEREAEMIANGDLPLEYDYNVFYDNQLREILGNSKYGNKGKFVEIWMDGTKGTGALAQDYDFSKWFNTIKELQPGALSFGKIAGNGIRWSGNEGGVSGAETCWMKMDIDANGELVPNENNKAARYVGLANGAIWSVNKCDVSIRNGWFHGAQRDMDTLINMYYNSVGHGSVFLLNVPPTTTGEFTQTDVTALATFGAAIRQTYATNFASAAQGATASTTQGTERASTTEGKFSAAKVLDEDNDTYWTLADGATSGQITIDLGQERTFDLISLQEYIPLGQRIASTTIEYLDTNNTWQTFAETTTIGARRLALEYPVTGSKVRITVSNVGGCDGVPLLSSVGVYKASRLMQKGGAMPEGFTYIDERDSAFTYSGSWTEYNNGDGLENTHKGSGNDGNTVTGTFTGTKFYVMGIVDPSHGPVEITIDGGEPVTFDTHADTRKTKQILYTSPDLASGTHTIVMKVKTGTYGNNQKKFLDFDGIYYVDNNAGILDFSKESYSVREGEETKVTVNRTGGSHGDITFKVVDLPGSAVSGQHYRVVNETITLHDSETKATVTAGTIRGSAANKQFYLQITNVQGGALAGPQSTTDIQIMDRNADILQDPDNGETYAEDDPFFLPRKTGQSTKLEAEHMILDSSGATPSTSYIRVSDDSGASNGKKLGWFEPGNKVTLYYNAPRAGVYTVTLRYQSGRTENSANGLNKVNWRGDNVEDFSGTIPGTGGDGSNYGEHSYQLTVTEAGPGSIEFYADASACPNIDWITFRLNGAEDPGEIVVPDGLVGYWTFDGDTREEQLTSKVNGLTATTATGVTLADSDLNDNSGGGVQFNGANAGYLTLNLTGDYALTTARSFSVGGWIKHTDWATDTSSQQIPSVFHSGGGQAILAFQHNNAETGRFSSYLGGTNTFDTRGVQLNDWCHVMLVYTKEGDISNLRFYVNGVASEAVNVSAPNFNVSGADQNLVGKILVGAHRNGSEPSVKAVMDEVRYYNRAITADEVEAIYEKDKPPVPPLTVTVDPETEVRQITSAMFGINHRYHNDGYGSWDKENAKIYDAFQALCQQAGFGSVRYPGGTVANLFTWKDAIGPVEDRTPTIAGNNFYTRANQAEVGGADPVDPVFGVDEAMTWIYDDLNAEAIFVYGLGRGDPDDAAELVEYLNAPATEEYPWAMKRAENGHPEPYGVTRFEIGNEFSDIGQRYWMEGKPSGANDVDLYIDGGIMTIDGTRNQYNGNPLNYVVRKGDWRPLASKSKGEANEVYYVCYTPVVADSAHVKVDGTEWTIVDSLADQAADAQVCTFDNATGEIRFGDGTHGAIPARDARVTCDYQTRQAGFVEYYNKMKEAAARIGVEIEIYSGIVDRQQQSFISKMNEKGYNDKYDGVIYHPYTSNCNYAASLTNEKNSAATIGTLKQAMDATGDTTKEVAVSEFGINANNDFVASMGNAIYTANHLIDCVNAGAAYLNRHCLVDFTTGDNLGNWQQSVIQCHRQSDGTYRYVATPSAHVFQLFNTMTGNMEVAQTVTGNADYIGSTVQTVNVYSTKDGDGNVYVLVVNNDEQNETAVELGVKDVSLSGKTVQVKYLTSDAVLDQNTLSEPNKVQVQTAQVEVAESAEVLNYTMKPHSIYAFRIPGAAQPVDTSALETAIANANTAKQGVQTIDGKTEDQVDKGVRFVTAAEMKALTDAIAAAEEARDAEDKTDDSVAQALAALTDAVEAFADAVKTGTKTGGSGTGGNSGGSTSSTTTTTEILDDGTKVTTVTTPDGTVTETAEKPDGTVEVVETKKDGTVTETKTDAEGAKTEKVTDPEENVTITVTDAEGEELAKVEIPAETPATETRFDDVPVNHWADKAIHNAAALELVKGVGDNKFEPVAPMSRGQLATVLHRLSQGKTDYNVTFQDVAAGKFYTEGVAWAAKAGVVTGISEDIFAPEQVITREQLAVMLARYAKLIGMDTKTDAKALEAFADGEKTGSWAVDGMAWCVDKGILQGKGQNNLDPTTNVTRAEVAVMLDRFIALLK